MGNAPDPHRDQPIETTGPPIARARAAVILVHGRGASACDILTLADEVAADDLAFLAPQAAGNTWYPNRFLAPLASNEPYLTSALAVVGACVRRCEEAGIEPERVALLGFSQGACLALEYAARNARRYGALIGLSGGLIGPPGTPRDYPGTLSGTPVLLGCSDVDAHIPLARVEETAEVLRRLGAQVEMRIYPGMEHTINQDEMAVVQSLFDGLGVTSAA